MAEDLVMTKEGLEGMDPFLGTLSRMGADEHMATLGLVMGL